MAWIRWRVDRHGARIAHVQWRDRTGAVRSRAIGAVGEDRAQAAREEIAASEEGRVAPPAVIEAREALRRFLAGRRALRRAAATIGFYGDVLGPLFDALAARAPLRRWTRAMLAAHVEGQAGWSPRTIQMRVVACRTFVKWARTSRLDVPDFVAGYVGPSVSTPETKHYTPAQADRLVAAAKGHRLEVAVLLALDAGLSYGDLETLRWEEVDVVAGWLARGEGRRKTGELLRVPLTDRLRAVLTPHARAEGLVCAEALRGYDAATNALRHVMKRAGLESGGWHRLRHSCGARLVALGVPIPAIRRWLGHAPGSLTTLKYLHADDSMMLDAAKRMGRKG